MDENKIQADFFKAFAHPLAIKVLRLLSEKDTCVCDMAKSINEGQPQVSRVLSRLKAAGLVSFERKGAKTCYKIKSAAVRNMLDISALLIMRESENVALAMKKKKGGAGHGKTY